MQKTFCDKCGEEIEEVDGKLTVFKVVVSCEERDEEGDIDSSDEIDAEICGKCNVKVTAILTTAGVPPL